MMFRKVFIIPLALLAALAFSFVGCNQTEKPLETDLIRNPKTVDQKSKATGPLIEFNRNEFDFGRLIQGEKATYTFTFTNAGNADLIISKVSASCGCTASSYTREAVKPGETGKVEVVFDSHGLRGIQNKTVSVMTNTTPSTTVLRVKAQVALP